MEKKWKSHNYILCAILILAAAVRIIGLDKLPAGVLPDEAYAAYNAWGMMTEGVDSRGYHWPVYFVAWGSGMSVLYSYLVIPLFRLFGYNILVYRLPQSLLGILSVYVFYQLVEKLWGINIGLLAAFVLAINPWHIMITRFGLDANMAPGMFLLGVFFLVYGLCVSRRYLIPSALFMGLTLYSYVLTWLMVPIFLLLCLICFRGRIFVKKTNFKEYIFLIGFVIILFLMALPLIIFVAVNLGWIDEVRTSFISIPKLHGFRGAELSIFNIPKSIVDLAEFLFNQYNDTPYDSSRIVGAYYLFTFPFMVIGLFGQILSVCRMAWRKKQGRENAAGDGLKCIMLLWMLSAFVVCIINEKINVTHINMLHFPLVFYGAYGVWITVKLLRMKSVLVLCLSAWIISFGIFLQDYITTPSGYFLDERVDEALRRAQELSEEIVIFDYTSIKYSYLLWKDTPSTLDFAKNAIYDEYSAWEELITYGRYHYMNRLEDVTKDKTYILRFNYVEMFKEMGFCVDQVNDLFFIAYP